MANLPVEYTLEIYEPHDGSCVAAVFKSDTPFMPISVGEFINTSAFEQSKPQGILEVVSVEHIFWESKNQYTAQKVCVRTKVASNPFA